MSQQDPSRLADTFGVDPRLRADLREFSLEAFSTLDTVRGHERLEQALDRAGPSVVDTRGAAGWTRYLHPVGLIALVSLTPISPTRIQSPKPEVVEEQSFEQEPFEPVVVQRPAIAASGERPSDPEARTDGAQTIERNDPQRRVSRRRNPPTEERHDLSSLQRLPEPLDTRGQLADPFESLPAGTEPHAPVPSSPPNDPPESTAAVERSQAHVASGVHDEVAATAEVRRLLKAAPSRALSLARETNRRFPDGMLRAERDAFIVLALVALERVEEARSAYTDFAAKNPGSGVLPRLRAATESTARSPEEP